MTNDSTGTSVYIVIKALWDDLLMLLDQIKIHLMGLSWCVYVCVNQSSQNTLKIKWSLKKIAGMHVLNQQHTELEPTAYCL